MAASIYCIIIEEICAITPGMLSRQTKFICCFSEILEDCSNNFERSKFLLLTVKSIRIKRMNVEIFCERGVCKGVGIVFEAFAGCKGRSLGARGVRRGAGACGIVFGAFAGASGVCREQAAFARACGVVFGAFAGARGRGALFLGRSLGARTACMIVFRSRREIFL